MIFSRLPAALTLALTLLCASYSGNEAYAAPGKLAGLQPDFAARLEALLSVLPGVTITSGYRSAAAQGAIYARALRSHGRGASLWAARPGHSMHEAGLAADLHFPRGDVRAVAHVAAARFGLVFPMRWEPWHVEPAGGRALAYAPMSPVAAEAAAVPWPIGGYVVHLVSLRHHGHHHARHRHGHHYRRRA